MLLWVRNDLGKVHSISQKGEMECTGIVQFNKKLSKYEVFRAEVDKKQ